MTFSSYLRGACVGAFFTGTSLGIVFLGLVLAGLRVGGEITLELDIGVVDGLWSLLILPSLLTLLTLLASPLVYLFFLAARFWRRRFPSA